MAKSQDGIEVGSYQTSGADGDLQGSEPKQRGGDGGADMSMTTSLSAGRGSPLAHPQSHFAHKRPLVR